MKWKKYPYRNVRLRGIKGEYRKDIRSFDLYFKGSNYGWIKRLVYKLEYSNDSLYIKPQKITKPVLMVITNSFMKDNIFLGTIITLFSKNYCSLINSGLPSICFNITALFKS